MVILTILTYTQDCEMFITKENNTSKSKFFFYPNKNTNCFQTARYGLPYRSIWDFCVLLLAAVHSMYRLHHTQLFQSVKKLTGWELDKIGDY